VAAGCSRSPIFCCRHDFLRCCCPARGCCSLLKSIFLCEVGPPVSTARTGFPWFGRRAKNFFWARSIFVCFIFRCRWTTPFATWAHREFFFLFRSVSGSILPLGSSFCCVSDLILRRLACTRSALVQEQRPRSSPLLRFSALATGSPRLRACKQALW
jgi:hypothetical protein